MPRPRLMRGQHFGPWTLSKYLGGGGNAEVWSATNPESEVVALKLLRCLDTKSEPFLRFRDEAALLHRLSGIDGVVPIVESNTSIAPAWIALELATCLETQRRMPFRNLVQVFSEIATTLAELALKGVYHRDIKPANLFLYRGRGSLSDFGMATFPNKQSLTSPGKKIGPVYFIAPEMLNEGSSALPAPADVYSLAKSIWVLASGQNYPLPGQLSREFEPYCLSTWVTDDRAKLLEDILFRSTDPDPSRRPAMVEFAEELRSYLATRDGNTTSSSIVDVGRFLRGHLLERKRDSDVIKARRQEFLNCRQHLSDFSANLASALRDQVGGEFISISDNANTLHLNHTYPRALQQECYGEVITIWGGEPHKAQTMQLCFGVFLFPESGDFRTTRLVAAQLCCRHSDHEKQFSWKDERCVGSSSTKLFHAIEELATCLESNLQVGLDVFLESMRNEGNRIF